MAADYDGFEEICGILDAADDAGIRGADSVDKAAADAGIDAAGSVNKAAADAGEQTAGGIVIPAADTCPPAAGGVVLAELWALVQALGRAGTNHRCGHKFAERFDRFQNTVIPYFPDPYPGEAFFSVYARFCERLGLRLCGAFQTARR
jgi:hypothetical protein